MLESAKDLKEKGGAFVSNKTIIILAVIAAIVVLGAVGYGIHHMLNPEMPIMK